MNLRRLENLLCVCLESMPNFFFRGTKKTTTSDKAKCLKKTKEGFACNNPFKNLDNELTSALSVGFLHFMVCTFEMALFFKMNTSLYYWSFI